MKTIQIDDDVFAALEKRVRGFNDTPGSVIRRLLENPDPGQQNKEPETAVVGQPNGQPANPFTELVTSVPYLMANTGHRYFQILAHIHQLQGAEAFFKITQFKFGGRIYFADNPDAIEKSGSSTNPKPIPGTKFWALSTLSNAAKRKIITDVLRLFSYSPTVISQVAMTLPDSGIVKSSQFAYPVASE